MARVGFGDLRGNHQVRSEGVRFASDSLLEGTGFEPFPRSYGKFRRANCGSHLTHRWRRES